MEIIKSENLFRKPKKNFKDYFNLKIFSLVAINLFAFLYIIDTIKMNLNKKNSSMRLLLDSNDPRTKGVNEICLDYVGNTAYDLFELENEKINLGENIEFRFCHNIYKNKSSCIYIKDNKIIRLAGDILGEKNNKNRMEITDSKEKTKRKVNIYLAAGDNCLIDESKKYEIDIELYCIENKTNFEMIKTEFDLSNSCNLKLYANSHLACGDNDFEGLTDAILIAGGIILILVGFLIGIFGYKIVKIGIFLVCFTGSLVLTLLIIAIFNIEKLVIRIVLFVIFIILGILLFVFFIKKKENKKYFMLLAGGVCGFLIGEYFIYQLFFSIIDTKYQTLIYIIIIAVCIIIGVIVGLILPKYTYIIGTSIIGAAMISRGLSLLLYKKVPYIDQVKLAKLAVTGNFEKIAEMVWSLYLIYPAITIVFTIIFIIIQIKINPNWKDVDDYKDLDEKFTEKPKDLPDFKLMKDTDGS